MKIAVIDDYQNAFPTLKCYSKLRDHEVMIYTDTEKEPARLAERLKDAEAVVLTQQRSRFPRAAIERLPKLALPCRHICRGTTCTGCTTPFRGAPLAKFLAYSSG